jgi:ABC-type Zn uptake system ZnuABC Zn-binding protein ZnuA/ABC-type Mn2+/Zn2+ transport system permease subunit
LPFDVFQLAFVQRGLAEVLLLSVAAGLVGTWIVLRGLAFYSHAVGTAAFPGLVLADGIGFAPPLGAAGAAAVLAGTVALLGGRRRTGDDSLTALALTGCLALGVILASDVFHSAASVEQLLFGSLLVIDTPDLVLAAVASAATLAASWIVGPRWAARGFDPDAARTMGLRSRVPDLVLLGMIALGAIAALSAIGALLATAIFVVPAATVRLWVHRLPAWQALSVALAALEGVGGLWLSVELNAPPGPTIAVIAGAVFCLALLARPLRRAGRRAAVPIVAALLAGVALLAGCGAGLGGGENLDVVASTTVVGDFVRQVGGHRVDVHQILHPNTDPHEYEPRPDDVRQTAAARVVFLSGDNLDRWMDDVIDQGGSDPTRVDLGAAAPVHRPGEDSGPEASRYDPHWWHDPVNARAAVLRIRDALTAADPAGREEYRRRAAAYVARLDRLDAGIRRCMAAVPAARRKLVTDHDAFGYFAHRYGIAIVGAVIPSQTTQAQPSAGDVAGLTALIRREGVRAIFPEESLSPRLAQAIARQTGATAKYRLYGDALGPADSSGATYLAMERANADAMVRGFTGGARGCAIGGLG